MKTIDRIIFAIIALALMMIALKPVPIKADGIQAVDIVAVAGRRLHYGAALPVE